MLATKFEGKMHGHNNDEHKRNMDNLDKKYSKGKYAKAISKAKGEEKNTSVKSQMKAFKKYRKINKLEEYDR